jgi:hypothetical protein
VIRQATVEELEARLAEPDMADLLGPQFDAAEWCEKALVLTDGSNIFLATEWADKTFEIHWLLRDRGRTALRVGIDFLRHLYEEEGARVVVGHTPAHKRAARWFSRQVGGRSQGIITSPEYGDFEVFSMTRQDFEARHEFPQGQASGKQEPCLSDDFQNLHTGCS